MLSAGYGIFCGLPRFNSGLVNDSSCSTKVLIVQVVFTNLLHYKHLKYC